MPRWLTRSAMFIALLLTLTACSRIGLAYRNLDLIIPWTLNDYLDIRGAQKDWFNERLKDHLTWHCTTQLPGYLDWLDRLKTMVQTDQVTDEALQQRTQEAEAAIAETAREITPSAIELLQGLNDDQVDDMDAAFVKDQRKRQQQYLKPTLQEQIQERSDRMVKRLDDRLGPLTDAQRQRVMALVHRPGGPEPAMDRQPRPLAKPVQRSRGPTPQPRLPQAHRTIAGQPRKPLDPRLPRSLQQNRSPGPQPAGGPDGRKHPAPARTAAEEDRRCEEGFRGPKCLKAART